MLSVGSGVIKQWWACRQKEFIILFLKFLFGLWNGIDSSPLYYSSQVNNSY